MLGNHHLIVFARSVSDKATQSLWKPLDRHAVLRLAMTLRQVGC
jgi:hypothetical protein